MYAIFDIMVSCELNTASDKGLQRLSTTEPEPRLKHAHVAGGSSLRVVWLSRAELGSGPQHSVASNAALPGPDSVPEPDAASNVSQQGSSKRCYIKHAGIAGRSSLSLVPLLTDTCEGRLCRSAGPTQRLASTQQWGPTQRPGPTQRRVQGSAGTRHSAGAHRVPGPERTRSFKRLNNGAPTTAAQACTRCWQIRPQSCLAAGPDEAPGLDNRAHFYVYAILSNYVIFRRQARPQTEAANLSTTKLEPLLKYTHYNGSSLSLVSLPGERRRAGPDNRAHSYVQTVQLEEIMSSCTLKHGPRTEASSLHNGAYTWPGAVVQPRPPARSHFIKRVPQIQPQLYRVGPHAEGGATRPFNRQLGAASAYHPHTSLQLQAVCQPSGAGPSSKPHATHLPAGPSKARRVP